MPFTTPSGYIGRTGKKVQEDRESRDGERLFGFFRAHSSDWGNDPLKRANSHPGSTCQVPSFLCRVCFSSPSSVRNPTFEIGRSISIRRGEKKAKSLSPHFCRALNLESLEIHRSPASFCYSVYSHATTPPRL